MLPSDFLAVLRVLCERNEIDLDDALETALDTGLTPLSACSDDRQGAIPLDEVFLAQMRRLCLQHGLDLDQALLDAGLRGPTKSAVPERIVQVEEAVKNRSMEASGTTMIARYDSNDKPGAGRDVSASLSPVPSSPPSSAPSSPPATPSSVDRPSLTDVQKYEAIKSAWTHFAETCPTPPTHSIIAKWLNEHYDSLTVPEWKSQIASWKAAQYRYKHMPPGRETIERLWGQKVLTPELIMRVSREERERESGDEEEPGEVGRRLEERFKTYRVGAKLWMRLLRQYDALEGSERTIDSPELDTPQFEDPLPDTGVEDQFDGDLDPQPDLRSAVSLSMRDPFPTASPKPSLIGTKRPPERKDCTSSPNKRISDTKQLIDFFDAYDGLRRRCRSLDRLQSDVLNDAKLFFPRWNQPDSFWLDHTADFFKRVGLFAEEEKV